MEVYERLKYLRKDVLKLNQESFAKKINLSRSNLANIESGRINLTERVLSDICRELSVNEGWLISGNKPIFINGNDSFSNEIIEIYKTLTEDNRKYLKGYIYRLLEEQSTGDPISESDNDEKAATLEAEEGNDSNIPRIGCKDPVHNEPIEIDYDDPYIKEEMEAYGRELTAKKKTRMLLESEPTEEADIENLLA